MSKGKKAKRVPKFASEQEEREFWETHDSTADLTSEETSLSFVCEENFGSGTFTESTEVSPSRTSSPDGSTLAFWMSPFESMY